MQGRLSLGRQSADTTRAGMQRFCCNTARERRKTTVRRAEHDIAGGNETRDRRETRKEPFEERFGHTAQARRGLPVLAAACQKIPRFLDKSRLGSPPATEQKDIGPARRLQGSREPVRLI